MSRRVARIVLAIALLLVVGAAAWWWLAGRGGSRGPGAARPGGGPAGERIEIDVDLYFPNGTGLAAERRRIEATEDPKGRVRAVVAALLAGPESGSLARAFPEGVEVGGVQLGDDGTAYVDLRWAERPDPPPAGSTEEMQMVYSVVNSVALNVPGVERVVLLWNGVQRFTFAGHLDTSRPLVPDRGLVGR